MYSYITKYTPLNLKNIEEINGELVKLNLGIIIPSGTSGLTYIILLFTYICVCLHIYNIFIYNIYYCLHI